MTLQSRQRWLDGEVRPSRRRVLSGGAAGFLALSLPRCSYRSSSEVMPPDPSAIGIQLYSLRSSMAEDVPGTLARVAEIGYGAVEFAGYFDTPPGEVRQITADLGLSAVSAHVDALLARDDPMRLLEAASEVGHEYVLIAWLPPEERQTLDQWREWSDICNRFAEQCRTANLRFAYHNHDFEFAAVDGVAPFDILLERCDPELVDFELDFFWARAGGRDALRLIAENPVRFPLCHVKDMDRDGAMVNVGEGVIDFAGIFSQTDIVEFDHYFVEHDDPVNPFAFAEISFDGLTRALTSS